MQKPASLLLTTPLKVTVSGTVPDVGLALNDSVGMFEVNTGGGAPVTTPGRRSYQVTGDLTQPLPLGLRARANADARALAQEAAMGREFRRFMANFFRLIWGP